MVEHLISIILPVYNQADHIAEVVRNHEGRLKDLPCGHEILLVVNGSRDRSLHVCEQLAAEFPTVRVCHLTEGGWGLAVQTGLARARGDLLCYTNSARTSTSDLMLLVLYALANPGAVIKANRRIRESWRRRLGSLLYNIECRMLFDLAYWDINGTPKIFPRSCARLLNLTENRDLIDLEFCRICREENYPILEVPIISLRRHGSRSTTNFRSALRLYWGAFRSRRTLIRGGDRLP